MLGKHKKRTRRIFAPAPLAIPLLAAGCTPPVLYTGTLQPIAGHCDTLAPPSLELRGTTVVFSPGNGVLVLTGQRRADGVIEAQLPMTGADRKPYTLVFRGKTELDRITGLYATPQCRAEILLHRHQD